MLGKSLRERCPESTKSTFPYIYMTFSLSYFIRFTLVFGSIKSLYQRDTMIGTRWMSWYSAR